MSDAALRTLLPFLEAGEPIPLHWAVDYGDAFSDAWAESRDPGLLIRIAALVGPRPVLVLAVVAMARETLPCFEGIQLPSSINDRSMLEYVLDAAESFANGQETNERMAVVEAMARQIASLFDVDPYVTFKSTLAAFVIADAVYLTRKDVFDEASAAANVVRNAMKIGIPRARLLEIIRQYIDPPPTLADVVEVRVGVRP